jgi:hypothetical protein
MSESKNRRVGRVVAVNRDNKDDRFSTGGIFSPFPGAYSIGWAVKNEDGSFDDVVAIKTRSGKKVDVTDYYFNIYINETLEPYDKE